MSYLLHVTPTKNVKSILRDGIIPSIGERSRDLGEPIPRSYYFTSADALDNALGGWLGEAFEDDIKLSLLRIDVGRSGVEFMVTEGFECESTSELIVPGYAIQVVTRDLDSILDSQQAIDKSLKLARKTNSLELQ